MIRPPERRCQDCSDFLKDKKTLEIPCKQCATPIYWPPESQLQTHLGAWAEPAMCGACKRDAMEAARAAEREALRHAHPAGAGAGRGTGGRREAAARQTDDRARRTGALTTGTARGAQSVDRARARRAAVADTRPACTRTNALTRSQRARGDAQRVAAGRGQRLRASG